MKEIQIKFDYAGKIFKISYQVRPLYKDIEVYVLDVTSTNFGVPYLFPISKEGIEFIKNPEEYSDINKIKVILDFLKINIPVEHYSELIG